MKLVVRLHFSYVVEELLCLGGDIDPIGLDLAFACLHAAFQTFADLWKTDWEVVVRLSHV